MIKKISLSLSRGSRKNKTLSRPQNKLHVPSFRVDNSLPPRERILQTVTHLFYYEGIHNVGVNRIAEVANTNKMTLYRHFKSKDDLIVAYLKKLSDEGFELWDTLAKAYPNDPKKRLLTWMEQAIDLKHPCGGNFERGCAFIKAVSELPDTNHPGRKLLEANKTKYLQLIIDLCREADLKDPEIIADELHIIFEGAVASAQSLGPHGPATSLARLSRMIIDAHSRKS